MAFTEDLAAFIDTDDFALAATYNGSTVSLILDRAYSENVMGEIGFQSAITRATLETSVVPSAAQGDTVVVSGTTYKVIEVEVDPPEIGQGFTIVRLEKQ